MRLCKAGLLLATQLLACALCVPSFFGCAGGDSRFSVDTASDPVLLESPAVAVEIHRSPFRLAFGVGAEKLRGLPEGVFYERRGLEKTIAEVLDATPEDRGAFLSVRTADGETGRVEVRFRTPRTVEVVFEPDEKSGLEAFGARWESPENERIYGLTERLRDSPLFAPGVADIPTDDIRPQEVGSLDRRGETVEMFVRPTFSLYAPFYHSSRGFGLLVGGTMPGTYDLAAADPTVVSFRFEAGTVPENLRFRFFFFGGPEHADILDEYTRLTGRPLVPPDWAFRNWRWRDELAPGEPAELDGVLVNAQVAEDVLMFERFGIPAGVYLLDRPVLQGNFGFARFEWDEERLPNARAMLEVLRRRGYRILTWSAAWACGTEPGDNGTEALRLGFLAPNEGVPFCSDTGGNFVLDVTNPKARRWFAEKLANFVREEGLDGIKLDRGEEHIPSDADDIWFDGRNGREVHNEYVILQARMHREALEAARPDGDWVLVTRAGYTGVQKDAIVWGGDIPGSEFFGAGPGTDLGLRSAIISQQRAAFLGFPVWGSDTGGYYEFKDREVFARWIEFSTFSGIMEIGGKGTHAPWDMPTEPRFDEEMIEIYRRYTVLREELLPYIVETAKEARTGMPIVRPMVFYDRTDPELSDLWDQYMFGPDLMVAPVWRIGQREREVYFPRGGWRSLWDETERYTGPSRVTLPVPLDTILVFVREGAPSPLRDGSS
ncbi:MAG: hypothetical protein KatS3mg076_2048 [Candidatus Binatia bacterium]|nr:MAG: hypothetical protein KatS3mg076_2048 [Candidatus Binatia bacterium]